MDDDRRAAERAEDGALVARARGDDPDAFGRLYARWFDRVHDLAYRITRDDAAASDVAQDAFVSAWRNLARLEKPTSPPAPDPTADIWVSRRGDYVTVTWSATKGVKWSISGTGVSASSPSGSSTALCPADPRSGAGCTYTIRVTNAAGQSVSKSAPG